MALFFFTYKMVSLVSPTTVKLLSQERGRLSGLIHLHLRQVRPGLLS